MQPIVLYERTQSTGVIIALVLGVFSVLATALVLTGEATGEVLLVFVLAIAPIGIVLYGASALTVKVTPDDVMVQWRFGWPSRVIPRADIVSVEAVRNRWWYGWGIRWTPKGWMWNVWGLDAALLTLTSGKGFLIGTDDPEGLVSVLS